MTQESETQRRIVGVRFREASRVFYFDGKGIEMEVGQQIVVQTPQGSTLARVVIAPQQVIAAEISEPLNPVLRVATPEDLEQADSLAGKVHEDLTIARKKVEEHELDMRLVGGESNLDGSQVTLFFTAEQRVDFRNLVRDISSNLKKRVQLLQVGERDRAKMAGDIGQCGYRLCCQSWLTSFPSISIRMAKEQDVPLNPSKISGVCGRLLCCLAFEHEQYRELKGKLPKVGQMVSTPAGEAKLVAVHALKQTVSLRMADTLVVVEMPMEELRSQYGLAVRPVGIEKAAAQPAETPRAREAGPHRAPREAPSPEREGDRPRRRRRRRGGRGGRSTGPPPPQ
ncbi:MAG: regulatory iron-sulfur-containing complex subunit RicT [Dehalococcoidia bacterium]|jgi:cell fate regulator YaaT (PSP1 superfamily)